MSASITEADAARALAFRILSSRARSRRELFDRLVAKGVVEALAASTVERCVELRLLDDRALAEGIVRRLLSDRPCGWRYLAARLRRRGIERGLSDEVIGSALEDRDGLEDALKVARARMRVLRPGLERAVVARRLTGTLSRRGFDPDVTRRALEVLAGE